MDFVGRLDVGSGHSTAKLVVLGQAKCEKLQSATGGNHIARTVARLRRGWIGAVEKRPVEVSRGLGDIWEPFFGRVNFWHVS